MGGHGPALRLFALWKVALTAVLIATPLLFPDVPPQHEEVRHFTREIHALWRPLFQWDGEHYMSLATHGYQGVGPMTQAFYPLLPWLIRATAVVVRSPAFAAFVLTTGFALGLVLVYVRRFDRDAAVLVLAYPTAFFLGVVYTEALFLALLLGFLYLRSDHGWAAAGCALVLPLCRGQGLLVAAAFGAYAIVDSLRPHATPAARLAYVRDAAAFGLGTAALFGALHLATGNPWTLFEAQKHFVFDNSVANVFDARQTWDALTSTPRAPFDYVGAWFDRVFMFAALLAIPVCFRVQDRLRGLLALALLVVPLLMGRGGSYARFSLLPFALLAPELAAWLRRCGALWMTVVVFMIAQTLLAARFALNMWVS